MRRTKQKKCNAAVERVKSLPGAPRGSSLPDRVMAPLAEKRRIGTSILDVTHWRSDWNDAADDDFEKWLKLRKRPETPGNACAALENK